MMTGLPFYLDKAESKKTKIGWFVFTIIAVIFEVFIVYVLQLTIIEGVGYHER